MVVVLLVFLLSPVRIQQYKYLMSSTHIAAALQQQSKP